MIESLTQDYGSLQFLAYQFQFVKFTTQMLFSQDFKDRFDAELIPKMLKHLKFLEVKSDIINKKLEVCELQLQDSSENEWDVRSEQFDLQTEKMYRDQLLSQYRSLLFHFDSSVMKKETPVTPSSKGETVEGKAQEGNQGEAKPNQKRVMISYNWAHQKKVLEIANGLKGLGYFVWLDIDQMSGDCNAAMANAVETSEVIIMCASEAYGKSANCRLEAQYANDLKKLIIPLKMENGPMTGWLGLLMAGKLWFPFYETFPIDALHKELQLRLGATVSPTGPTATGPSAPVPPRKDLTKVIVIGQPENGRLASLKKTDFASLHESLQELFKTNSTIQMYHSPDENTKFKFQIVDDESARQCGNVIFVNIPDEFSMIGIYGKIPQIFKMARLNTQKGFEHWFEEITKLFPNVKFSCVVFQDNHGDLIQVFDEASLQRSLGFKLFLIQDQGV